MQKKKGHFYTFGPFRLDAGQRILLREGEPVALTQKAFETLYVLVQNSGRVIEKDEMMSAVWPDSFVEETTLAQNIFTLRRILGETPEKNRYIKTVPRRGYRFIEKVYEYTEEETETAPGLDKPPLKSLAVLPFKALSPHEDDHYFGLGMADMLITKLSNIRKIIVRPTSAVLKYDDTTVGPLDPGRELKVQYVLEGRIHKSDDRIRVTAQLVDIESGAPLWADKFDAKFIDIFSVQDKISEQLVEALTIQLTSDERRLLAKHQTRNSEAYQSYLKGRYQWNRWTEEGFIKSIQYFREVIEIDSDFALAYTGLSDAYSALVYHGFVSPLEAVPEAKAAAEQALAIDMDLAEGHFSLASVLFFYDWDWPAAEKEFLRAIELNPGYATAYQGYGLFLTAMRRFDEAIRWLEQAIELDPVSLLINTSMMLPYYYRGDYEKALEQGRKSLDINQEFGLVHVVVGNVYTQMRRYDEAIAEYLKASRLLGHSPDVLSSLGYTYAALGKRDAALKVISQIEELQNKDTSQVALAIVYVGLGEKDKALELLERGYELRINKLVYLNIHPFFDSIRSDPRFTNLLNRVGLLD